MSDNDDGDCCYPIRDVQSQQQPSPLTRELEEAVQHRSETVAVCERLQATLAASQQQVKVLREQVKVGDAISGSFFEALKPLRLASIHVQDPGQHVTDLIATLTAREARITELEGDFVIVNDQRKAAVQEAEWLRARVAELEEEEG